MKSIRIKMEKIRRLFSRTGFVGGLKVLADYLGTYIKAFFVGTGDVLFITSGVGDSAKYRAYNTAEELRLHGIRAQTTISDNPNLPVLANKFKVFIFHRVNFTVLVEKLIVKIKEQQKEIIFDTDDLVYDPKYITQMDYFQKMGQAEQALYKNGIGAEIISDSYVKVCTTTVSYLAKKLQEKDKKVFIVPNRISEKEWELSQEIIKNQQVSDGFLRLAYVSGTLSHNADFASIEKVLAQILHKYPKVKLMLMGPLDIPAELFSFEGQLEIIPFAQTKEFLLNLSRADINLAPLELDNPFCESKSAIRFSTTGALGIPTVAVKNQTFSEAMIDGVDGFLAETQNEWVEKISRLIEDEAFRKEMGEKAHKKVEAFYITKNSQNEEYYNFLKSRIKL